MEQQRKSPRPRSHTCLSRGSFQIFKSFFGGGLRGRSQSGKAGHDFYSLFFLRGSEEELISVLLDLLESSATQESRGSR